MNQVSLGRRGLLGVALGLATLVLAFAAPVAFAGPSTDLSSIDPDLAGSVATTSLVGQGDVQVETSVSRIQDGTGTAFSRVWSTPTLLRFGMPNYEIRLATQAYSRVRTFSSVANGMSDVTLGLKGVIPQAWNRDLSLAVMVQAGLPSGSQQLRSNGVRPEVQFVGAWTLPNQNLVRAIAAARSDVDVNDERHPAGMLNMNFTHTWNPQFLTYGELGARQIRGAWRGGKDVMYGLGAGWRPIAGTQLDATAAWGLKRNDTDVAFTLGVSRRFHPPMPAQWGHKHDDKTESTPSASTEDGK
jgi:hypothetical protein